jgi:hypothetical protein
MHARSHPTLYEQLEALPGGLTGEILDGQLHTQPRPSGPHGRASSMLEDAIFGPYGRGGPGGWWIFIEPVSNRLESQSTNSSARLLLP